MNISDLVDTRYDIDGFFIRKPQFVILQRIIEQKLFKLLEEDSYLPVLFPTLISKDIIQKEVHHIEGFEPSVYWVEKYGYNVTMSTPAALAISSETVFCKAYTNWLKDGESLPFRYYQTRSVFRAENKDISPLLREREFMWIEAHTAFKTEEECRRQIEADILLIKKFFSDYDIDVIVEKRSEEDKCPGAVETYGMDVYTNHGIVQVASTHFLGQRFSTAFNLQYDNQFLYQTSFGIGVSRLIGVLLLCEKI